MDQQPWHDHPFRLVIPGSRKPGHLCRVHGCKGNRGQGGRSFLCPKHLRRELKIQDPCEYHYTACRANARKRARERGINPDTYWQLSREKFRELYEPNKHNWRIKSLDRVNAELGYTDGNVQVLTCRKNSKKFHAKDKKERDRQRRHLESIQKEMVS